MVPGVTLATSFGELVYLVLPCLQIIPKNYNTFNKQVSLLTICLELWVQIKSEKSSARLNFVCELWAELVQITHVEKNFFETIHYLQLKITDNKNRDLILELKKLLAILGAKWFFEASYLPSYHDWKSLPYFFQFGSWLRN